MKITANQVTIARVVLLPIPTWLLLSNSETRLWLGLFIAVLLGFTDTLDGIMARRAGPTVLGGLLDPVADKIFIAAFLTPIVGLGHCYWWLAGLIFFREFLVTNLRTQMVVRKEKLVTSQLGKVKTIAQMGGLGLYVFVRQLDRPEMFYVHGLGVGGFVLTLVVLALLKKRIPFWLYWALGLWAGVAVANYFITDKQVLFTLIFSAMALLTWWSGAGYIAGAIKVFRKTYFGRFDAIRTAWSFLQGMAVLAAVSTSTMAAIPALIAISCALGIGGIDNIAAAERGQPIRAFILLSMIAAVGCFIVGFVLPMAGVETPKYTAFIGVLAVLAVNLVGLIRAFAENKEILLEKEPRPL